MKKATILLVVAIGSLPTVGFAGTPNTYWSLNLDKFETRYKADGDRVVASEAAFEYGSDDLKLLITNASEYDVDESELENIDSLIGLKFPVSTFYDGVVGARADTPDASDQFHLYLGLQGLAKQFIELDAGLSLSEYSSLSFEAEYEGLITNRIVLSPSIEVTVPLQDNPDRDQGAWGAKAEVGLRLSYDLVGRVFSPYIGFHHEQVFGKTADLARADGKDSGDFYSVLGGRFMF